MGIRGTYDVLPARMRLYRHICDVFYRVCLARGYEEVMTPILEDLALFERTLGESSDVVSKEMFVVHAQKDDVTVLRPENTAGAMRLFLENFVQETPKRLCYFGPMFRYERPQKGRYRQFYQFGVECLGVQGWCADVEAVQLAWSFMQELGIHKNVRLEINTIGDLGERAAYKKDLRAYLLPLKKYLSAESCQRLDTNVLRILDTKDASEREILAKAPRIKNYLSHEAQSQFSAIQTALTQLDIPFSCNDFLVRGLDYYNHHVFEFISDDLGAQSAVLGGGRYDGLASVLNQKHAVCAVGWAAGMERIAELVEKFAIPKCGKPPVVALIVFKDDDIAEAYRCGRALNNVDVPYVVVGEGSLRKKMKIASRIDASFSVLFGAEEMSKGGAVVRDMQDGGETFVLLKDIAKFMEKKYRANSC